MNDFLNRKVAIFTAALELPAGQRTPFLQQTCGDDQELRQQVEALLTAHEGIGDFLEKPASDGSVEMKSRSPIGEKPGDRIGRYKLLQQIGEGGCGVVFMAEQEQPLRRRVALKIVKPGMDTKCVIARFEAERQALALMDHPNIAKVFDAGSTDSGRPYFVMELIRGIKITEYCDQQSLTTVERLKLFIEVCQAIQHAHQKGIIHRDIKPSNILVTTTLEGAPLPVVIDFGVAKATNDQRLTDKTLFTAFEMLIGTPAYMSPEQAAFTSVDVDTRTDIYSLGVLLYEILTAATPFDTRELLKAGLDEVRRAIRQQEPARPSTRLSTMAAADLTTVALHRRANPPALIRDMRGDLDWIVMKALEKNRACRYATANALAMDLQRYLAGEVVLARPPNPIYRLHKLFLRHKWLLSGLIVVFLLAVTLSAIMSHLFLEERRQREQSDLLLADTLATAYVRDGKPELAEPLFLRGVAVRRHQNPDYLPSAQSLEDLMWALLYQGKFAKAEALLNQFIVPPNRARPEYADLLRLRAEVLARSGQWAKAEADAVEILNHEPADYGNYHRLAALQVANHHLQDYRRLCTQIVDRVCATAVPLVDDPMAKDCLILPATGVDLVPVAAMARMAVTRGSLEPAFPLYQCCLALAEYRQGHFEEAVKWAQFAAANPFPYSRGEADAVLAMAQYHLGQVAAAHLTLDRCEAIFAEQLPPLGTDLGGDWRDWIIFHTLLQEAQSLIQTASSDPAAQTAHTQP